MANLIVGVATVQESTAAGFRVGERIYGYFPMAQYVIFTPVHAKKAFFFVDRPHLPADRRVYNQYFRKDGDVEFSNDQELEMMIFRPLWGTSFFLNDFLSHKGFYGSDTVLVSSASSKTAYCLALLLKDSGKRVIGLTSSRNMDFVNRLGWYEDVLSYDALKNVKVNGKVVYCDVAGSNDLNDKIHSHFGNQLAMHVSVGMSHFDGSGQTSFGSSKIDRKKIVAFFAPEWIKERVPKEGDDLVKAREHAWKTLLLNSKTCVDLKICKGEQQVKQVYLDILNGKSKPNEGFICSLWDSDAKL